jgi:hypothetical protein
MELNSAEQDLASALVAIVARHGKLSPEMGIHPGYDPPEDNPESSIGVACANCYFYDGPFACQIVEQAVQAMGKCRFAVIPDGVVRESPVNLAGRTFRWIGDRRLLSDGVDG